MLRHQRISLPDGKGTDGSSYFLQARLNVSLPGLPRVMARALADLAHQICPYSKAVRGNIAVAVEVMSEPCSTVFPAGMQTIATSRICPVQTLGMGRPDSNMLAVVC